MATNYTSLLGFALPTTGELSGTWGQVVNDNITELVEDAIAATATASVASGDWTLSTTGSGSANEARCAILIPTGSPGVSRNIIAPSQSKAYVVINQSNAAVVVKGSATTGVTIAAGAKAVVAWNGSDFVTIASSEVDGVSSISFGTTGLTPNTATSGAVTVAGTLAVGNGGTGATTLTGVVKGTGTSALTAGTVALGSEVSGTLPVGNGGTGLTATPSNGQIDIGNGSGFTRATLTAGTGISVTNGAGSISIAALNNGTVTSVTGTSPVASSGGATPAISLSAAYGDTLNPYGSKTAKFFLAAPNAGDGVPTFRAVVASDIPTLNQNTTGTASNVTGTVAVGNGGTGATTLTANNVILGNGGSAVQFVAPGTTGNVLKSNGTTWTSAAEDAQVYPGAGIAVSTGSAWGTSKTTPTGDVVGTTDTQTLSAKRINPRVVNASGTSGNLTIAGDTTDLYKAEGLTGAITFLQPSGTPVDGQKLMIRLEDNGTARGITWTTSAGAFRAIGITLPTTTVLGKVTYVGCVYNSTDSFWDAVATVTQA
jgi:hypothetical protein